VLERFAGPGRPSSPRTLRRKKAMTGFSTARCIQMAKALEATISKTMIPIVSAVPNVCSPLNTGRFQGPRAT
jgi:hypothetical protein